MPKLDSSLYVGKQQDYDCYNTEKTEKRKDLQIGETCYNNKECESKNCSNVKILKIPGKCIFPKNTGKVDKGGTCIYEKDCKKNLICENSICVKKPISVSEKLKQQKKKKTKKKGKGLSSSKYVPSFLRKKSTTNSNNNNNNQEMPSFNDTDLKKILENDNFFLNNKSKFSGVSCDNDNTCKQLDSDHFCYKNKCVGIHKRCNVSKIDRCIREPNSVNVDKDCCDKNRNCVYFEVDGIKNQICVNKQSLFNIGDKCNKNSECKSNFCSDNKICLNKINENIKQIIPCKSKIDCIYEDTVCGKNKFCVNKNNKSYKELDIFESCNSDSQCKSKKCDKVNINVPIPKSIQLFGRKCIGSNDENIKQLNEIFKKDENLKNEVNLSIKSSINTILEKCNKENFCLHASDTSDEQSLALFVSDNKVYLSKICNEIYFDTSKNETIIIKTIIYYNFTDVKNKTNSFSEDYKNIRLFSNSKESLYYKYFNKLAPENTKIINFDDEINIKNKFIFDYIVFNLFGKRKIVYTEVDNLQDNNSFYTFKNKVILNNSLEKEKFIGLKNDINGNIIILGVPFKKIKDFYYPVYKDFENYDLKKTLSVIVEKILKSKYYNFNERIFNLLRQGISFNFKNDIKPYKIENNYKIKKSVQVDFENIENTSIFIDAF